MKHWKSIAAGSGIALAGAISLGQLNWSSATVDADSSQSGQPEQSLISRLFGPETATASLSKVVGRLSDIKKSGRVAGRASITMILEKLIIRGKEYGLDTEPRTVVARSTRKRDAAVIAGAAAIVGGVLATEGVPVAYGRESRFAFTLSSPLELPILEEMGGKDTGRQD